MAIRQFSRLSVRYRVILIVITAIVLPAELIVHSVVARKYYYLDVEDLKLVARTAAKTGAEYLPADPRAAVHEANAYARVHGIAPTEIVFTELSSDNTVLTIRLDRKIPLYLALLALGLPARDISVTASAGRESSGHPAAPRSVIFQPPQSSDP
jgi:hypothetical protein